MSSSQGTRHWVPGEMVFPWGTTRDEREQDRERSRVDDNWLRGVLPLYFTDNGDRELVWTDTCESCIEYRVSRHVDRFGDEAVKVCATVPLYLFPDDWDDANRIAHDTNLSAAFNEALLVVYEAPPLPASFDEGDNETSRLVLEAQLIRPAVSGMSVSGLRFMINAVTRVALRALQV